MAWEPPPASPFKGVKWSLGLLGFIGYVWVVHKGVTPFGETMVIAAVLGVVLSGDRIRMPIEWVLHATFLIMAGAGVAGSRFPDAAAATWVEVAKVTIIFFVAVNVVRTPAQLRFLIIAWVFIYARYPVKGAMVNWIGGVTVGGRVAWNFAFSNPNELAAFSLTPVAMCAGLLATERRRLVWWGALSILPALCLVVSVTQSRAGMIALGAVLLSTLLYLRPKPKTLAMLALAGAMAFPLVPDATWDRLSGLKNIFSAEDMRGVDQEGSAEQRYAIWKVARAIIADYPVFGVGIGAYAATHREYASSPDLPQIAKGARDTHSTYLNTIGETGFVGLILLAVAWIHVLYRSGVAAAVIKKWSPQVAAQLQFLRIGFVGLLVAGIWGTYQKGPFMWCYMAILITFEQVYVPIATAALAGGNAPALPQQAPARRTGRTLF
ncbi:MAG: O-antigen ligase family protein [Gemmatimonadetes bacterium]|nr:O-antigen ligase family protein [Gemmatimonadota bacterium]